MSRPRHARFKSLLNRLRRRQSEPDPAKSLRNEPFYKFDLSEDFYIRFRCRKCDSRAESPDGDDEQFTECHCGSTDIWATRGRNWCLSHETEFWRDFKTTADIKVPKEARKWLVGQERPMERELMEMRRWIYKKKQQQDELRNAPVVKIRDLEVTLGQKVNDKAMITMDQKTYRVHFLWDEQSALLEPGNFMKENPGPYILRISEPGLGKTLASKILREEAGPMYKEAGIELTDVLTIENPADDQRPLVRQIPCHAVQGGGCLAHRVVQQAERGAIAEQKQKQHLLYSLLMILLLFGSALIFTGLFVMGLLVMQVGIAAAWFTYAGVYLGYIVLGSSLLFVPLFIMLIGGSRIFQTSRTDMLKTPFPIVQHDDKPKYVYDATVVDSATMMGSIQWNAYGNCFINSENNWVWYYPRPEPASAELPLVFGQNGSAQKVTKFEAQMWKGTAYSVKGKYLLPLDVTDEHPFLTIRRLSKWDGHESVLRRGELAWRKPAELTENDYLIVPKPKFDEQSYRWLRMPNGFTTKNNLNNPSPVPDSVPLDEEVSYLLGWYAAEGWAPLKTHTIGFTMHEKETPIAERLAMILNTRFGLKARIRARKNSKAIDLLCKSKRLTAWLRASIGTGAHNKRIPVEVFQSPESVRRAFLRGYLMGDGHRQTGGNLVVKTVSIGLHRDTHALLLTCGILGSAGHRDSGAWFLSISPRFTESLFDSEVKSTGVAEQFIEDADNFYVPVESTTPFSYEGTIYNIVPQDHTIMAPMVTHNTAGLTNPMYKRVIAGLVHRAHDQIADIDEIKNMQHHTAVEMLSVMEDGESIIRNRGSNVNVEASGILAISTADPVPADFMLVANGNMDMIHDPNSIINQIKAFFDRFNYGDAIYYEKYIDATFENQLKIIQVITDETSRFRLYPMEKAGCQRVIEYMRERSDNNQKYKIMFRAVIKVVLKSFEIALGEGRKLTTGDDVEVAIVKYCDTVPEQEMKEMLRHRAPFQIVQSTGSVEGRVNGLAVISESAGAAFPVVAETFPVSEYHHGDFVVTGTRKNEDSWVQDSIKTVRTVIRKLYGIDIAKDHYTHIGFAQQKDVEGPSAGVAMTLALMSRLGDPRLPPEKRVPIPIRQDVAVTGTIELLPHPTDKLNVRVGAIGGVPYKIRGAANAGCKYVVIPMENALHTLTEQTYPCEVFGADSILAYLDLLRADQTNIEDLLAIRKPTSDEEIVSWANMRKEKKQHG